MKQILQFLRTGVMEVAELPCPQVAPGHLLIQTSTSLISAGSERMLVEFSKANIIQKARMQPERVKQVLDKIRTDGLVPTLETVFRKLDVPLPLGYCNVGTVLEVGAGVRDFQPGDRVASNGPHAEIACVPRNLCAKIPDSVTDEQAVFTVLASIGLQGVRLAQPTLGERFLVMGVGLVGLLTAQFLLASGCEVLVSDFSADRLKRAEAFGARTVNLAEGGDPIAAAQAWTQGQGVDGVLVTASAKTDEIMHQAAEACRKRGRIVLVGVVGLNLRRSDFYAKELSFQVSCSYGPGRYDEKYEQGGQDYPAGYVRWTEQRNFEAVLGALRSGKLSVEPLITDRFPLADAVAAYEK
ncbi:MAG TPA: zinc-binding alcohol dehydrogenase, partial [Candidatus Sumerlaeota bacterium]|nr:zinc-binding alcohol dehydrogenase [Candidatus Sumerlaeota bacterium]